MIPGILGIMPGIGDGNFSAEFLGYTEDEASQTTFTFLAEDFGSPSSSREIFVGVSWAGGAALRTISSATIGGIAAGIEDEINISDGVTQHVGAAILSAAVPSGTSGTIAITFSGENHLCVVGVYRVIRRTGIIATATDSYTGGNPIVATDTIDAGSNGAIIAVATFSSENAGIDWVGVTETYDDTDSGGTEAQQTRYSGALITGLTTEVGRTVSATQTSSTPPGGAAMAIVSIN